MRALLRAIAPVAAASLVAASLVAIPTAARAQRLLVVTRPSILRAAPSSDSARLAHLDPGDIASVLDTVPRDGYTRVRTSDEDVGWLWTRNTAVLDEAEVPHSAPEPAPAGDAVTLAGAAHVVAGEYDGCPVQGTVSDNASDPAALRALNRLKNRSGAPTDAQLASRVSLAELLRHTSDDSGRWSTDSAAEIAGYVVRVLPGGRSETGNCRKTDLVHRDTHIELALSPSDTAEIRRVIVEVTPRWRAAVGAQGTDWSTSALEHALVGHWVRVRGWLLFDAEHANQSENTKPGGAHNWRATAWEIHPVTAMTVLPGQP